MTLGTAGIVVAVIGILVLLWNKVSSLLLGTKSAKLTEELNNLKESSNEQVAKANVSAASFRERLRLYRSSKRDS